jgi:hypothetical protein
MSRYLSTRGMSVLTIAVCDRCKMKRPLVDLTADRNSPGLRVCNRGCNDEFDPWRLPARATETITVDHPRPDEDIST